MSTEPFPPFPEDVPTHPLLVIDYDRLVAGDQDEIEQLWKAGTQLGFWYLKNHGADTQANEMFRMGEETMRLPLEEKLRFEQGDDGVSFGYKAAGLNAVNASGELDTVEFINIAKDDALTWPEQARRAYPSSVNARMESTIAPFVRKSLEINNTILNIFNMKLGLPDGALAKRHSTNEFSGSEARCIKNSAGIRPDKVGIGAHTDFGSLSFLHNRLGGLQVLPPGAEDWQYVKPIPGHAICNIGDALALFSGGILRSNLHRVLPAPGAQNAFDRWSLVYFTRPGNSVLLRALVDESPLIAEAVTSAQNSGGMNNTEDNAKTVQTNQKTFDTGATALEWFSRRIRNQRIHNWEGPETWKKSRGTEDE